MKVSLKKILKFVLGKSIKEIMIEKVEKLGLLCFSNKDNSLSSEIYSFYLGAKFEYHIILYPQLLSPKEILFH